MHRTSRAHLRDLSVRKTLNAIKYTPNGGAIHVRVRRTAAAAVEVDVEDTGPGIGAAHRERIFERFYRIDAGRSRDQGGFGLGLSIARWAVELNGGRIELESREGKGSIFRVILPTGAQPVMHTVGHS